MATTFPHLSQSTITHSTKIYEVTSIYVSSDREKFGLSVFPTTKDNFNKVLNVNGFNLIRKGTFFAQDIYSEGYKRDDITVVVDGERYHSACPNRMDSPLTRVNPLEMKLITLDVHYNTNLQVVINVSILRCVLIT